MSSNGFSLAANLHRLSSLFVGFRPPAPPARPQIGACVELVMNAAYEAQAHTPRSDLERSWRVPSEPDTRHRTPTCRSRANREKGDIAQTG